MKKTAQRKRIERDRRGRETAINILTDEQARKKLYQHLTSADGRALQDPWFDHWMQLGAAGIISDVDVREIHSRIITDLASRGLASDVNSIVAVAVPLPSIGLPPGYLAVRSVIDSNRIIFVSFFPRSYEIKVGNETSEIWYTIALTGEGRLGSKEALSVEDFIRSDYLNYLNELLIAYKTVRHDHSVFRLSSKTIPSLLHVFSSSIGGLGLPNATSERIPFSDNDLHQILSKRKLKPGEIYALQHFGEQTTSAAMKYLVPLALNSIEAFCNGWFETAILDSDRFTELSLKLLLKAEPEYSDEKLQSWSFYEPKPGGKGVIETLVESFGFENKALIKSWQGEARKVRNRIVHGLDFDLPKVETARRALQLNLQLVSEITSTRGQRIDDYLKLAIPYRAYYHLYEREH